MVHVAGGVWAHIVSLILRSQVPECWVRAAKRYYLGLPFEWNTVLCHLHVQAIHFYFVLNFCLE